MDASTLIDWLNKANTMIREFAYEVLRLSRQVIDAYGLPLNESEFLIVLSISTLTITVIFNEIRKPRTRTYIPAKGAPRQNKRNKIQMQEEGSRSRRRRSLNFILIQVHLSCALARVRKGHCFQANMAYIKRSQFH